MKGPVSTTVPPFVSRNVIIIPHNEQQLDVNGQGMCLLCCQQIMARACAIWIEQLSGDAMHHLLVA